MDRYAVFGNPIGHSRSPRIHARFAEQTRQEISYSAILAPIDDFAGALHRFVRRGGRGANVTVPFKLDALAIVTRVTELAARAGAVNTIEVSRDGSLVGHNTDGLGVVRDLQENLGIALAGRAVLVIGAGGAVRGILGPLLDAGVACVRIANRTPANAQRIVDDFAHPRVRLYSAGEQRFDLVVNGTSAGLGGTAFTFPDDVVAARACAYDLSYGAAARSFLEWSRERGVASAHDGLGMLVEQAAESFALWRGVRPETQPVIEMLREELSA